MILEPRKIKSATVSTVSPSFYREVMVLDAMISVFWMLSFKSTRSLSSFTFIKRLREVRFPCFPDISVPPLMLPRIFHYRLIPRLELKLTWEPAGSWVVVASASCQTRTGLWQQPSWKWWASGASYSSGLPRVESLEPLFWSALPMCLENSEWQCTKWDSVCDARN